MLMYFLLVGDSSSVILFSKEDDRWLWIDRNAPRYRIKSHPINICWFKLWLFFLIRRDPESVATIEAPQKSLLVGELRSRLWILNDLVVVRWLLCSFHHFDYLCTCDQGELFWSKGRQVWEWGRKGVCGEALHLPVSFIMVMVEVIVMMNDDGDGEDWRRFFFTLCFKTFSHKRGWVHLPGRPVHQHWAAVWSDSKLQASDSSKKVKVKSWHSGTSQTRTIARQLSWKRTTARPLRHFFTTQKSTRTCRPGWMSRWVWSTCWTSRRSTTPTTSSSNSDCSGLITGGNYKSTIATKHHRVKYHNLKRERSLNALSLEELSSLWVPPLVFENTADNEAVEGTKDSEVCIFATKKNYFDHCWNYQITTRLLWQGKEILSEAVLRRLMRWTFHRWGRFSSSLRWTSSMGRPIESPSSKSTPRSSSVNTSWVFTLLTPRCL